jgi:hypothetical protein
MLLVKQPLVLLVKRPLAISLREVWLVRNACLFCLDYTSNVF